MISVLLPKIDSGGFFVEDVFVDGDRVPEGVIAVPVPVGFYRPRWDGMRWMEGATPQEILDQAVRPDPDWQLLIKLMGASPDILTILSMTSNAIALICLIVEVHSERARYAQIKTFWDAVIDSIQTPIPTEFRSRIGKILEDCHIPLPIDENHHMITPQTHEVSTD